MNRPAFMIRYLIKVFITLAGILLAIYLIGNLVLEIWEMLQH